MMGLIGGPMLIVAFIGMLFGVFDAGSGPQALLSIPEIVWEGSLGIYLVWKGVQGDAIMREVPNHRLEVPLF